MRDMKGYARAQAAYDAQEPPGQEDARIVKCSQCDGTGKDEDGEVCRRCNGEGERDSTPEEDAEAYQDAIEAKADLDRDDHR